jgi:hypothetical protein
MRRSSRIPSVTQRSQVVVDRRSPDPINVLGRELNQLCREVADPLDLAAHLEALGYTRPRIQREFGLNSSFELAERLFARTERLRRLVPEPDVPGVLKNEPGWPERMLLGVGIPVGLALLVSLSPWWALALWLGVWSQAGTALWWRLRSESDPVQMGGFVTLMLVLGGVGVGLGALLQPASLGFVVVGAVWLAVVAMAWRGALLWVPIILGVMGLGMYWHLPSEWMLALALLLLALSNFRAWGFPGREVWLCLQPHLRMLPAQALYGLGRAVFLMALLGGGTYRVLLGVLILALMLTLAEAQRGWLNAHLNALLWREEKPERFREGALTTIARQLFQLSLPLIVMLVLVVASGSQSLWLYYMLVCAFLGFVLALGVSQVSLEQVWWPGLTFLLCGGAVLLFKVPFALAAFVAILLLGVGLVLRLPRVHSYAGRLV